VVDGSGNELGFVFRTSPVADDTIGYQGPTDTLVGLDKSRRVIGLRLRKSFDNDPYVRYVRDEDYFLNFFNERSLPELAELDLFEARVEGVSGATMTSLAVAESLVAAAKEMPVVEASTSDDEWLSLEIDARNAGTLAIALLGLIVGFGPAWLRRGVLRRVFQLVVIGGLGLLNGDLISMAVIVGWSSRGVPWQFAPGLVALVALTLLIPMTSREQIYCNHLCPHGALQQLLLKRLPWQLRPGRVANRLLALVPLLLLVAMVVIVVRELPVSLVDLEPFDAWIFKAAGVATIAIAVAGLLASLVVPMAYCRFGCPTGAMLNFIRFNGDSDRWSYRDTAGVGLLVIVAALM
jgi:NosR/NirI family transcriptional regulator, nitrous oxide reductase regulator